MIIGYVMITLELLDENTLPSSSSRSHDHLTGSPFLTSGSEVRGDPWEVRVAPSGGGGQCDGRSGVISQA